MGPGFVARAMAAATQGGDCATATLSIAELQADKLATWAKIPRLQKEYEAIAVELKQLRVRQLRKL